MSFEPISLYFSDAYKAAHKLMLAQGTTRLYGTEIPRSLKYGPQGATHIVNFGKQIIWKWIHDQFQKNFFERSWEEASEFVEDMSLMLMQPYNGEHFEKLHKLGYLPVKVCTLPEGIQTLPNIPHSDFINTVSGFAWLTLYLETLASSLSWKPSLAATIALQYKINTFKWVTKTDPNNAWLIPYLCHDFSARGLNPHDQISVGLGHATSFRGSDTLVAIPAARYYYGEPRGEVITNSVNASEHSVTCTGIFYYEEKLKNGQANDLIDEFYSFDVPCEGSTVDPDYKAIAEWANLRDWLKLFPSGILSVVSDTFDLWKLIKFILPRLKKEIMSRDGKLVVRPDSGDPVDIICGKSILFTKDIIPENVFGLLLGKAKHEYFHKDGIYYKGTLLSETECKYEKIIPTSEVKGVIELLGDIFGYIINDQGYKVLDPHIGAIYGDSITLERQVQIYKRLATKDFASTNIVLGVGSFTYQFNTRDSIGLAYKGAWFEIDDNKGYNIYKDPITDDGTKKSLKGFQFVYKDENGEYRVESEVSEEKHNSVGNLLQPLYIDGVFYNQSTFKQIRERINSLVEIEELV
jgi:nicotinamide phosphoribosyltransferase